MLLLSVTEPLETGKKYEPCIQAMSYINKVNYYYIKCFPGDKDVSGEDGVQGMGGNLSTERGTVWQASRP